jgi:alanyl-tRNA synthetase
MNITDKILENDCYQTEFKAVVLKCAGDAGEYEAVLDRTCFYPEGGGQPADRGTLGMAQVLDVRERDGVIYHKVDRELPAGSDVRGNVDWNRRFSNMQQHSGEHILSGIIHGKHGFDNVGFHIGSEFVTLDFNGLFSEDGLREAEELANAAVYANIPVDIKFPDKDELGRLAYRSKKELEGRIRIVTFPGYDCCACCGTHVRNTGEIGKTGSGKTRFCLEVAKEALSLNKRVFYLDTENNLTKHQIQTELKGAVFNYTPVMEEIYETVMKLPDNTYDVVVIDSIGFPILSEFAELKMNQRGAVLLKMIALLANLKKWAYKNNGIVVVSNQPESEFNKVAGTILDPFGDKSNYAAKEIWHSDKTSSDSNRTISKITAFRSRSAGRGKKILEMTISDSGTKISV